MGCSALSVVASVAGAGLISGAGGLLPGLGGLPSIPGLSNLPLPTSIPGLDSVPGFSSIGTLSGSLGGLGTNLIGDLSSSTSGIVAQINSSIGGVVNDAIAVCGDAVKGALGDVTGSLSGIMSGDLLEKLDLEEISFPGTNLFENISQQGADFLQHGYAGLTECISTAKSFCEQSAFALGSISAAGAQMTSFVNLGSTFGQITGGAVNNLLNPIEAATRSLAQVAGGAISSPLSYIDTLQGSINQSSGVFKSLTGDMSKWGSMFDIAAPNNFYSPTNIAENLVQKNIPSFNKLLESNNINPVQLSLVSEKTISKVLDSAPPEVVRDVVSRTNFQIPITKLSDTFNPEIVLSENTRNNFKDFTVVSKQINSIGPTTAQSFGELGNTLSNIEFPEASVLIDIERDRSKLRDVLNPNNSERVSITGSGSGIFTNPTMDDIMGSFTGTPYNAKLAAILQGHRSIAASTTGQAFDRAVKQAVANSQNGLQTDAADAAAITAAYLAMVNDTENKEILSAIDSIYGEIQNLLVSEKRNLKAARLDPADAIGSIHSIMTFVQGLETAYEDNFKIGYRDWVESAASPDVYGAAIKAAIIEGKNKAVVRDLGLDISPASIIDLSDEVLAQQALAFNKCCPPFNQINYVADSTVNILGSSAISTLLIDSFTPDLLVETYCDGVNLYGIYADSDGLNYARLIEANSLKCLASGLQFTVTWDRLFMTGDTVVITITSDSPIPDGTELTFTSFLNTA